jgi:maleylacetate reductase
MLNFIYEAQPNRVVFGESRIDQLAGEVARLGAARSLILSTPGQRRLAEWAAELLDDRAAGIYAGAVMHVPIETAAAARAEALRLSADSCVAIGGGSTIGLAKAIALELGLPIVAVPTTYAGSEMTTIWGLTEGGVKRTGRDPRVLPRTVIYDPALTLSLPARVAGPSGINALAHCVEALYAPDANPIITLMAEEGIRALAASLPAVIRTPGDLQARARALYGAWLAGTALGTATLGLHHKLCHTLGGSFNLPHAEVHTVILPRAAAYNAAAAPAALARAARALGADDAPSAIFDLAVTLGAPTALRDIGMRAEDLDAAADLATRSPYPNPAPVTRAGVRRLLEDAFYGQRPTARTEAIE